MLLDSALRLLLQLLCTWRSMAASDRRNGGSGEPASPPLPANRVHLSPLVSNATALHHVEGFALAMLCQCRPQPRKTAVGLLREAKHLLNLLTANVCVERICRRTWSCSNATLR